MNFRKKLVAAATAATLSMGVVTPAASAQAISNPLAGVPGFANSISPTNGTPIPRGSSAPPGPIKDLDDAGYLDEALVAVAIVVGIGVTVATLYNNGMINDAAFNYKRYLP